MRVTSKSSCRQMSHKSTGDMAAACRLEPLLAPTNEKQSAVYRSSNRKFAKFGSGQTSDGEEAEVDWPLLANQQQRRQVQQVDLDDHWLRPNKWTSCKFIPVDSGCLQSDTSKQAKRHLSLADFELRPKQQTISSNFSKNQRKLRRKRKQDSKTVRAARARLAATLSLSSPTLASGGAGVESQGQSPDVVVAVVSSREQADQQQQITVCSDCDPNGCVGGQPLETTGTCNVDVDAVAGQLQMDPGETPQGSSSQANNSNCCLAEHLPDSTGRLHDNGLLLLLQNDATTTTAHQLFEDCNLQGCRFEACQCQRLGADAFFDSQDQSMARVALVDGLQDQVGQNGGIVNQATLQAKSTPNAPQMAPKSQQPTVPLQTKSKTKIPANQNQKQNENSSQPVDTTAAAASNNFASHWRQALLQLNAGHSGSYKVAEKEQRQLPPVDMTETTTTTAPATPQTRGRLSAVSTRNYTVLANSRSISRPGRSPVSLQRATNARLTRHRLKIQQQRQEQLAQLALRERQQLRSISLSVHSSAPPTEVHSSSPTTTSQAATSILDNLLERIPSFRSAPNHQQSNNRTRLDVTQLASLDNQIIVHRPPDTNSQRRPVVGSAIIDICDNQPTTSQSSSSRNNFHRPADVIVFRSIDMLRANSPGRREFLASSRSSQRRNAIDTQDLGFFRASRQPNIVEHSDHIESDLRSLSSSSTSSSTLSLNRPFCKICHLSSTKAHDKLISPCKCAGTMQYVHCGCLLKWLEISNRSNEKPMSCELCAHEYTWHKKFNRYSQLKLPRCSLKDIILHLMFVVAMGVMLFSALAPVIYKNRHQEAPLASGVSSQTPHASARQRLSFNYSPYSGHSAGQIITNPISSSSTTGKLANDEKLMLLCAATFFASFFVAIYVQTKARDTLYGLITKFLDMNQTYYITEYDHGGNGCSGLSNNNSSNQNNNHHGNNNSSGHNTRSNKLDQHPHGCRMLTGDRQQQHPNNDVDTNNTINVNNNQHQQYQQVATSNQQQQHTFQLQYNCGESSARKLAQKS